MGFKPAFEPFFTTKKVRSETGIGLAINYQIIVEKHKYHLKANSNLGRDTGFLIEITYGCRIFRVYHKSNNKCRT
jgi:signal transduction histidine kinase